MKIIEIIILVAAAAIVAAVIVCGIIRKKKGKTGCDCGCSGCPYHGRLFLEKGGKNRRRLCRLGKIIKLTPLPIYITQVSLTKKRTRTFP